jgi:hypothetical protein
MARENPTWGQARVAAELSLKLGIQVLRFPRWVGRAAATNALLLTLWELANSAFLCNLA